MIKRYAALAFVCFLGIHGAAAIRAMEKDDPNLDKDWDWRTNSILSLYYSSNEGATTKCWPRLPYYTPGNGLNSSALPDIQPEDGWMLVHKDFGMEGSGQAFPFYSLYNRYRGIFRIMLFNAISREGTYFLGELSFLDGGKTPEASAGVMTFADNSRLNFHYSLNHYDPSIVLSALSNMTAYGSWAVFDFPMVGYDPELKKKDPILVFRVASVDKQDITLKTHGDIQLFQMIENGHVQPGSSFSTDDIYNLAKVGYATYKNVGAFVQNELLSEAGQKRHQNERWFNAAKAIAKGPLGSYVPIVGAMGAVINSFVGGANHASEWEPLKFSGQFQLNTEGTIQTRHDLWCQNLFLNPGRLDDMRAQRPLRNVDWGVFNFADYPRCTMTLVPYNRGGWSGADATARLAGPPPIMVNPDSGMDLKSTRVAFVLDDIQAYWAGDRSKAVSSEFMTVREAMEKGYQFDQRSERTTVKELVWELRFKVQAPTRIGDDEVVFYRRTTIFN